MASTVPFLTRIAGRHAKEILTRDRARAQKILQGINPHGPAAFHEARRRRHGHHGHHGHGGGSTNPSSGGDGSGDGSGSTPGNSPPSTPGGGVDVTDAGVTYTMSVGVGSPATQYTLLIDTGKGLRYVRCGGQVLTMSHRQLQHLGRR